VTFKNPFFKGLATYPIHLRHFASQSLQHEIDRVSDEQILPLLLIMFAFWIVCAVEWTQRFAGAVPDPRFWSCLSLLVTFYGGFQIFRLRSRLPQLPQRKQGVGQVTDCLERIRSKGFVACHNVTGEGRKIDHVVVGPAGVYTVEARARSGSGIIEYRSDDELIFADRIIDGRPLREARAAAQAVQARLNQKFGESYAVQPLVVFLGDWRVHRQEGDFAVEVTTADQLEDYFDTQRPELTGKEIAEIYSALTSSGRADRASSP
jgi:Nuclease-related domain